MTDIEVLEIFFKTTEHFYSKFTKWLDRIPDPRNPNMITYKLKLLLLVGILMFVFKLESRRNINFILTTEEFKRNLLRWLKLEGEKGKEIEELEKLPHGDTLAYLLERLAPRYLAKFRTSMVRRLIRRRALEKYRLFNTYYTIIIDSTWQLKFNKEREGCLRMKTREDKDGKPVYIYYRPVLEAKLVTPNGLVLSIASEFIENTDDVDENNKDFEKRKQDCELRAFYRLAPQIKEAFPQLKICLLLDSLYAARQVFGICKQNNWKYLIGFKEGSMPAVYQEFEALKKLAPENSTHFRKKDLIQDYQWVTELDYEGHKLNVVECHETTEEGKSHFVWLTNLWVSSENVKPIAKGGRLRWKIENEGFNMQKNGGYELEHAYSLNDTAIKNFYYLLQIAHIFNQLMEKGSLLKDKLFKVFGSIRNFSAALLKAFTSQVFHFASAFFSRRIQIRFALDST